jgi:hypothetical protein
MSDRAWRVMPIPGIPMRSSPVANRGRSENMIAALKAREAENSSLRKRVVELEIENRRLWDAMRATGELLRKLVPEDD